MRATIICLLAVILPSILGLVGCEKELPPWEEDVYAKLQASSQVQIDIPSLNLVTVESNRIGYVWTMNFDGSNSLLFKGLSMEWDYKLWIEVDNLDSTLHPQLELTLYDADTPRKFLKYNDECINPPASTGKVLACIRYRPKQFTPNPPLNVVLEIGSCGGPVVTQIANGDFTIHMTAMPSLPENVVDVGVSSEFNVQEPLPPSGSGNRQAYGPRCSSRPGNDGNHTVYVDPIDLQKCIWTTTTQPLRDSYGAVITRQGNGLGLRGEPRCGPFTGALTHAQVSEGPRNCRLYWIIPSQTESYSVSLTDESIAVAMGLAVFEDPNYTLPPCLPGTECNQLVGKRMGHICRDIAVGVNMIAGSSIKKLPLPGEELRLEGGKMYYLLVLAPTGVPFASTLTVRSTGCSQITQSPLTVKIEE